MGMKDENTFISTDEPAYKKFISCRESAMQQKETMQIWGEEYKKFITTIDDDIKSEISSIAAHYQRMLLSVRIEWITRYLKIIKLVVNTNDYDDTIQKLKETAKTLNLFWKVHIISINHSMTSVIAMNTAFFIFWKIVAMRKYVQKIYQQKY